jgi:hypothetical protein
MARQHANKESDSKADRKRPEDTSVAIPVPFEEAIRAFLTTPPPHAKKKPKKKPTK